MRGCRRAERRGRIIELWLILPQMRWQDPAARSGYLGVCAFGRLARAVDLDPPWFDSPDHSAARLLDLSIWAAGLG